MTDFSEIRTETMRRIYADLAETEVVRFTNPHGVTIWVRYVILDIITPDNDIHCLTVYGTTENGDDVKSEFWEEIDEYPDEIASFIPELIKSSEADEKTSPVEDS